MARIRTIKPDFFRHELLYDSEQRAGLPLRLAFAGLMTAADRAGRFRWRPRQLKLDVLPYDNVDFGAVLDALALTGFIVRYEVAGEVYGAFPSWSSHQVINNRESESILPAPPCPPRDDDASGTRAPRVSHASGTPLVHAQAEGEGEGEKEISVASQPRRPPSAGNKQKLPACPFEQIVEAYHEALPELPPVKLLDAQGRKTKTGKFWIWVLTSKKSDGSPRASDAGQAMHWIRGYFDRAKSNDFLMGRSGRGEGHQNWRADFEFIISDKGRRHVIEKTEVPA